MTLIVNFQGGPVGLDTLAAAIGEDAGYSWRMFTSRIFCRMDFSTELRGGAQRPHLPTNISESTGFHDFSVLLFTPFTVTWSKCIPNHLR